MGEGERKRERGGEKCNSSSLLSQIISDISFSIKALVMSTSVAPAE